MKELYTCHETSQIMSKTDWQSYYNNNIDKAEYNSFSDWWYDMKKSGVLETA